MRCEWHSTPTLKAPAHELALKAHPLLIQSPTSLRCITQPQGHTKTEKGLEPSREAAHYCAGHELSRATCTMHILILFEQSELPL